MVDDRSLYHYGSIMDYMGSKLRPIAVDCSHLYLFIHSELENISLCFTKSNIEEYSFKIIEM